MGTLGNGVIWHCGGTQPAGAQCHTGGGGRWGGRDEGHSDMGMYGDMWWRYGAEMGFGAHCHPAALEVAVLNAGRDGEWQILHRTQWCFGVRAQRGCWRRSVWRANKARGGSVGLV